MIYFTIFLILAIIFDVADFLFNDSSGINILGFLGSTGRGALVGLGIICVIGFISMLYKGKEPTALDVYKGNAEIKVVYTDTIPTDTIVVWRDGRKREW